tara:strand:- start:413 stop:679 length:267 start_codon:yes stop_codon:yes gene_type:complete
VIDELSKLRDKRRTEVEPVRFVPIKNDIMGVMHCKKCLDEKPNGDREDHADYAQLDIGWTPEGIQVWCRRHDTNVLILTLKGEEEIDE